MSFPYRRYDAEADRLFLIYYPIPAGFNANNWGVTESSIPANIHTALNKPVVILRKNAQNPFHTKQAGNYIHPTMDMALAEIGKQSQTPLTPQEYYQWQEKFAVGHVKKIDKREGKGYAFTLEITDPEVKNILKSEEYKTGIPGWTSPQILYNAKTYGEEDKSGVHEHWEIAHIALVDLPAYGYEQSALKAKCFGDEKECIIKTKSASEENLGYCIRSATRELISAFNSSLNESSTKNQYQQMSSESNNSGQPKSTSETLTYSSVGPTNASDQPTPGEEKKDGGQQEGGKPEEAKAEAQQQQKKPEDLNKSLKEIQMEEIIKDLQKQVKLQGKELEDIRTREKFARLSFLIPRDLFKSDDSHKKEVERTLQANISEEWLVEYWKTKRELAAAQTTSKKMVELEPIAVKNASREVPDFNTNDSSQVQRERSNVHKHLELQDLILGGQG